MTVVGSPLTPSYLDRELSAIYVIVKPTAGASMRKGAEMARYLSGPIQSMRLENLRNFADTGYVDFAPINFLFGKNSSGKTTLLRAPLLFKQLVTERSLVGGVPFAGPHVDFGSYPETVRNGERSQDITLTFDLDIDRPLRLVPPSVKRVFQDETVIRFVTVLHWNAQRGQAQVNSIYIGKPNGKLPTFAELVRLGPDKVRVTMNEISRTISGSPELGFASLLGLRFAIDPSNRELEFLAYVLSSSLLDVVQRIQHIGPLRDMPERAYRIDQLSSSGGSTEHVVGMLVSHRDAVSSVSKSLRQLGIARAVDVVNPAPGYAGIVLSTIDGNRKDNLADVGFGASQVLPIIVKLALASPGSMVLVEQPELHLHPEVQGELADVMIDLALDRRLTLFVESHSENMLLRLRRRIATGRLAPEAVRVYVTDKGQVKRADLDRHGRIDMGAFPDGFFEEEWLEAMGIIEAGARKQ